MFFKTISVGVPLPVAVTFGEVPNVWGSVENRPTQMSRVAGLISALPLGRPIVLVVKGFPSGVSANLSFTEFKDLCAFRDRVQGIFDGKGWGALRELVLFAEQKVFSPAYVVYDVLRSELSKKSSWLTSGESFEAKLSLLEKLINTLSIEQQDTVLPVPMGWIESMVKSDALSPAQKERALNAFLGVPQLDTKITPKAHKQWVNIMWCACSDATGDRLAFLRTNPLAVQRLTEAVFSPECLLAGQLLTHMVGEDFSHASAFFKNPNFCDEVAGMLENPKKAKDQRLVSVCKSALDALSKTDEAATVFKYNPRLKAALENH